MYQFSRAIYRELARDIDASVTVRGACAHEHVLRSCEATIERLVTDRHYFARPAARCSTTSGPTSRCARRRASGRRPALRRRCGRVPGAPAGGRARRQRPARCSAARRRAAARLPARPAAAQRLLPVAPAPRRDRGAASSASPPRRTASRQGVPGYRPGMLLGVDVGGTFTDAVLVAGAAAASPPRRRRRPTTSREGVHGRGRAPRSTRAGRERRRRRALRARDDRRDQRAARGHAARARRCVATEGFTDVVELGPPGARATSTACARRARAARRRPSGASARRERMRPGRRAARARRRRGAVARRGRRDASPRRSRSCLLHAYRDPAHERALGEALRARLGDGVHVSLSHEVVGTFREYERAATTEVDAALSPLLGALPARARRRARRRRACPSRAIMQSSGGLADARAPRPTTPR